MQDSDVRKLIKALEEIEASGYGDLPIFIQLPGKFARLWDVGVLSPIEGADGYEGTTKEFIGLSALPIELLQMLEDVTNISEKERKKETH